MAKFVRSDADRVRSDVRPAAACLTWGITQPARAIVSQATPSTVRRSANGSASRSIRATYLIREKVLNVVEIHVSISRKATLLQSGWVGSRSQFQCFLALSVDWACSGRQRRERNIHIHNDAHAATTREGYCAIRRFVKVCVHAVCGTKGFTAPTRCIAELSIADAWNVLVHASFVICYRESRSTKEVSK